MESENLLELKDVSFTYDEGTRALVDINFYIKKGEFIGILASNGSGKTTLLKTFVRLIRPQKGEVLHKGIPLSRFPEKELYQKIGMVFQNPDDQLFSSTVGEDVAFGPRNLKLPAHEIERRVKEALELVGMSGLESKAIHHLSFGQQKRVAIAGILAMRPEIMILDEPTSGLDPKGESVIMHLLSRLNRENKITIIMATHMIDIVPLFIDRLYVLNKGEVKLEGAPEVVFSDPSLMEKIELRLPYITSLIDELRKSDGVPLNGLPLTINEARRELIRFYEKDHQKWLYDRFMCTGRG